MGIISYQIAKNFGENEIIKNFTFEAKKGEITLLLGANGTGKTTWINIAVGLVKSTSGNVYFGNKKIEKVRDEIAIVFDEPQIYKNLNGYDNLEILTGEKDILKDDKEFILNELSLDNELMKKKGKAFSFGQRHKLSLAAALLRNPKYLFLDEPSIGLDFESWENASKLLRKHAEKGCSIIITGHNYDLLQEIVDKVIIIKEGIIVFTGSLLELMNVSNSSKGSNASLKEAFINILN